MATPWQYKLRGGTAAEWSAANPILRLREPGVETNTGKFKMGDGQTFWSDLPYYITQDRIAIMISEAIQNAAPISPAQVSEIVDQVKSELTLPNLVLAYENAKA